jgi:hypothetical protein
MYIDVIGESRRNTDSHLVGRKCGTEILPLISLMLMLLVCGLRFE